MLKNVRVPKKSAESWVWVRLCNSENVTFSHLRRYLRIYLAQESWFWWNKKYRVGKFYTLSNKITFIKIGRAVAELQRMSAYSPSNSEFSSISPKMRGPQPNGWHWHRWKGLDWGEKKNLFHKVLPASIHSWNDCLILILESIAQIITATNHLPYTCTDWKTFIISPPVHTWMKIHQ